MELAQYNQHSNNYHYVIAINLRDRLAILFSILDVYSMMIDANYIRNYLSANGYGTWWDVTGLFITYDAIKRPIKMLKKDGYKIKNIRIGNM